MPTPSRKLRGRPTLIAAIILTVQDYCPIPLGNEGIWRSSSSGWQVRYADGTDGALQTAQTMGLKTVRAATTAALAACTYSSSAKTLTANANGALGAIDGVALAVTNRLLVKNQADGRQNGIYVVTSLGAGGAPWVLTRANDANTSAELEPGMVVSVTEGTVIADTLWQLTTNAPITLDTTSLTFARESGVVLYAVPGTFTGAQTFAAGTLKQANAGGDFKHTLVSLATADRTITLPDADLTPALAGVNTADDGGGPMTGAMDATAMRAQESCAHTAPGTNIVGQYAAGAPIADAVGPFVTEFPHRTVQIARGGAGVPTVYTVTGVDPFNVAQVETINSNGAATVQGTKAWGDITEFSSDVDPTVTTDLQTGKGFAVANPYVLLSLVLGVDGVTEAPATTDPTSGTVVPTTAPNGTKVFTARYTSTHTHGVGSLVGPVHHHGQT